MSAVSAEIARPVSGRDRFHSLDLIRGVALFGILLMNIAAFGLPHAYSDPTIWGGSTGMNLWAWITTTMLFEGTQRGLFSLLFGAGMIVLTSRLEAKDPGSAADIYYRRLLWMILFGTIHSYVILWVGEILYYYGIAGLFLYALRKLSPRTLLLMALTAFAINAVWSIGESTMAASARDEAMAAQALLDAGTTLSEEQQEQLDTWTEMLEEHKPPQDVLAEDIEAHKGSYIDVFTFQAPYNADWQSWGLYRYFFDIFSMMLVGMALLKLGVLTLECPSRTYWRMMLIGYAVGLSTNYYELRTIVDGDFSTLAFMQANWTYDIGRLAMTAGHLGMLLLFCRSGVFPWLQRSLAAVGRMALSNYVAHSIICAFVFYGFGFGLYGDLERYQLYYVVFGIWIAQLIISPIWLDHYRFGPLEWVWRSLTYLAPQPFKRGRQPSGLAPGAA